MERQQVGEVWRGVGKVHKWEHWQSPGHEYNRSFVFGADCVEYDLGQQAGADGEIQDDFENGVLSTRVGWALWLGASIVKLVVGISLVQGILGVVLRHIVIANGRLDASAAGKTARNKGKGELENVQGNRGNDVARVLDDPAQQQDGDEGDTERDEAGEEDAPRGRVASEANVAPMELRAGNNKEGDVDGGKGEDEENNQGRKKGANERRPATLCEEKHAQQQQQSAILGEKRGPPVDEFRHGQGRQMGVYVDGFAAKDADGSDGEDIAAV